MKKNERIIWLDYVRGFAILCVVMNHTLLSIYKFGAEKLMQETWCSRLFSVSMFTVSRLGVPLFLFLTGFLMCGREYSYDRTKSFMKHKWLSLLITTEIWIVFYNLFNAWFYQTTVNIQILVSNMLFLRYTKMSHMWYMPMILGIYLFIPILANALSHTDIRILFFPLAVTFFGIFLLNDVNIFFKANGAKEFTWLLDVTFSGGAYGVCLILGYLTRKGVFDKIKVPILLAVGALSYGFTVYMQLYSSMHGVTCTIWYNSAFLLLAALCIFLLASKIKFPSGRLIVNLSTCAFGIFLIHNPIQMVLLHHVHWKPRSLRLLTSTLVVLAISWAVVAIGSKSRLLARTLFFIKK